MAKRFPKTLHVSKKVFIFAPILYSKMAYTKETMVIKNPSEKLLKAIEELRKDKLAQLEELRNMKPEDFSRRVILS